MTLRVEQNDGRQASDAVALCVLSNAAYKQNEEHHWAREAFYESSFSVNRGGDLFGGVAVRTSHSSIRARPLCGGTAQVGGFEKGETAPSTVER